MASRKKERNQAPQSSVASIPTTTPPPPPKMEKLISQAIQGERNAIDRLMHQLQSPSYELRRMLQDALHLTPHIQVWAYLLGCLASGEWRNALEIGVGSSPRLYEIEDESAAWQSVAEAFAIDWSDKEKEAKESLLKHCLEYALEDEGLRRACHYAAAYLKALRGDVTVIPSLEHILQHGSKPWKLRAVQALACLPEERSAAALFIALVSGESPLHQEASKALNEFGEKARQVWIRALSHADSHIRWHGARGLGQIGDPQALDVLVTGLLDENQAVRWATARVLANLNSTAIPAILHALSHYPLTEPFRQAAYHALHAMPSKRTQEYLAPLLEALRSPAANLHAPRIAQRMSLEWKNLHH